MHTRIQAVFCMAVFASCATAADSDWPQWRGPNRDGIALNSPKLLDAWPKEGPQQLWKSEWIPACEEGGVASPVVADGKVFVYANAKLPVGGGQTYKLVTTEILNAAIKDNIITADVAVKLESLKDVGIASKREWEKALGKIKDVKLGAFASYPQYYAWRHATILNDTVVCLDAASGKTLWRKDFPVDTALLKKLGGVQWWTFEDGFVSATPAVWSGKCYAAGAMGLYCLSAKDGALLWQAKADPEHCSPLVANGIVYHAGVAYNAESGAVLWKNSLWDAKHKRYETNARYSSPLLFAAGGRNYIVTSNCADDHNSAYVCLDLETGKVQWSLKGDMNTIPTLCGDLLMVATSYAGSGAKACRITPAGAEVLWKKPFSDGLGDIVWQDHLYVPGGAYKCLDLKSGEFNWKQSMRGGVGEFSATVLADGKLFTTLGESHQLTKNFGDLTYSLAMIKATPEKYVELGVFNPKMCMMTSPAIAGGKLYLRLLDGIACYDLQEHAAYLDAVAAAKDALTFRFKQTGGGLAVKDPSNGLQIADAAGTRPAAAQINGDEIVVDIRNAAVPFSLSYAGGGALAAKNGQPVTAFAWNEARLLKFRKGFENTIMLTSDLPLQQDGRWNKPENFELAGAKVTRVDLDPEGKGVNLITDKTWKTGDAVTLMYAAFPVSQGEPRREKMTATVAEPQRAAAKFVKGDETTSGNWKGVYGTEGAVICAEKAGAVPKCANVTVNNKVDSVPWANTQANTRNLQLSGNATGRSITWWRAGEQMDVDLEFTDGKEHQVALYLPAGGAITVEMQDADTKAILDTQTLADAKKEQYLVWNLKGQVIARVITTIQDEGHAVWVGGVFIDPPAAPAK
ncbi:MAG: PQQ-like beta-propeller repeat protein [Planctomycetes bacterium]|nr:PQQ-like beta-propeller repeat protein [Planctomycetota bacterium]